MDNVPNFDAAWVASTHSDDTFIDKSEARHYFLAGATAMRDASTAIVREQLLAKPDRSKCSCEINCFDQHSPECGIWGRNQIESKIEAINPESLVESSDTDKPPETQAELRPTYWSRETPTDAE